MPAPLREPRAVGRGEALVQTAMNPGPIQMIRLARSYLEQRRLMEALVVARKAVVQVPEHEDVRLVLAEVHQAKGDLRAAEEQRAHARRLASR
jgi:Tfp pilus assembly protein PilF